MINKKSILWIVLDMIFVAVFNTVFFVEGGVHHPASVWISYGFIHFSYLMVLLTPVLTRKSSSASIFGFAIYNISSAYFALQFVVGLIFIFISSDSYKASLLTQIVLAGIYGVILISHLIANENTADSVEQREYEVAYIKNAAERVKSLIGRISNKKADKAIEKAYDTLHASPTKSHYSVRVIEEEIIEKVELLEDAVLAANEEKIIATAHDLVYITEERNRKLKLSN